jgi:2-polyprenyl-3-methyl-5-hydroxy-6-metoxy-1,4-benzoquinol methylase
MGLVAADAPVPPDLARVEYLSRPRPSDFPEEWYDLGGAGHFWFDWRLRAFLGQVRHLGLDLRRPLRLLDVGGGAGILRDQLEAQTSWIVDLADLNPAALGRARRGRGRCLCYDVTAPSPELEGAYDAALLFDVIEHLDDPRSFVAAVVRHLRPTGHLFVNVPAGRWLFSSYDEAAGHVRRYGRSTLRADVLADGRLEMLDLRAWGLLLVPLLAVRKAFVRGGPSGERVRRGFEPPGRLAHALLRGLERAETAILSRPPWGSSLLLAARKRND